MIEWFRSWHGAPTDHKWLVVARRAGVAPGIVSAVVWALFDHASQADERGSVTAFDVETYAAFSGFEDATVEAVIAALYAKGVIDPDGRLVAWDKRQPKREDASAERTRVYRERMRTHVTQRDAGVTQCDAAETHGDAPDKELDTDTDTETDNPPNPPKGGNARKRATTIPDGFPIASELEWAKSNCPHINPDLEAAKFRTRAERDRVTYVRWPQAWRHWCLNAEGWARERSPPASKNDVAARMLSLMKG